jgi:DnaJ domain
VPDYYAVLQVHPDAEFEVIEAAYRQLMKKHHPDRAGEDPRRQAVHLARAKAINEAFSVLRDPQRRRDYDFERIRFGTVVPPRSSAAPPSAPPPPRAAPPRPPSSPPPAPASTAEPILVVDPGTSSRLLAPLAWLGAAYYLLPGPYEWERGRQRDVLSTLVLPIDGVVAYALASGRLSPWIGHSLGASIAAWSVLALLVVVPMWGTLPRVAVAALPSLVLLSGAIDPMLQQAHVPLWLAWGAASALSLFFAARLYVFGVLPTLAICVFISRL